MVADVGGDEEGESEPPLAWGDEDHGDGEERADGACDHEDLFAFGAGVGVGAYEGGEDDNGEEGGGDAYGPEGVASLLVSDGDGFEVDGEEEGDDEEGEGLVCEVVEAPGEDFFGVFEVLEEFGHWGMIVEREDVCRDCKECGGRREEGGCEGREEVWAKKN